MECLFCLARRTTASAQSTASRHILSQIRTESSLRRTRTALRIPPHPSFGIQPETPRTDHIIFNPPSSAPNEYHTPLKFLPPNDPRRRLYELTSRLSSAGSSSPSTEAKNSDTGPIGSSSRGRTQSQSQSQAASQQSHPKLEPRLLPPAVRKAYEKKYHLTPTDVEEIRRLRAENPAHWTVARLAVRFECSQYFIGLCSQAPVENRRAHEARHEASREKWGREKREAREDRVTRRALWGRST